MDDAGVGKDADALDSVGGPVRCMRIVMRRCPGGIESWVFFDVDAR